MGRKKGPFKLDFKIQTGCVIYDPDQDKLFVMVNIGKNMFLWDGECLSKLFSSSTVKVFLSNPLAVQLLEDIYIDDVATWASKNHFSLIVTLEQIRERSNRKKPKKKSRTPYKVI